MLMLSCGWYGFRSHRAPVDRDGRFRRAPYTRTCRTGRSRRRSDCTRDGGRRTNPQAQTITPQPAARSPLTLGTVHPGRGATVESRRPAIDATFANALADPNAVKITLDGLDITNQSSRSATGFVFSPPSDLQSIEHEVRATGKDTNGVPFDRNWKFTSGTSMVTNEVSHLRRGASRRSCASDGGKRAWPDSRHLERRWKQRAQRDNSGCQRQLRDAS
jgi:hypothetical protein